MPKEKLMLIDGNALVHRAYHALPPLTGPSGEPTNATFGFTSMLLKALNELRPTHVVVAFDVGRTFRHERYAEYKANRARMDEELAVQFESVRRVVDAIRQHKIPVVFSESTVSDRPARQIAAETGARYGGVLYVDSLSEAGGPVPTYLDLLRVTSETIVEALSDA